VSRLRVVIGLRWCLACAFCLGAFGCGASATARAEATQGQFRLVFELPRNDWRTGESITGQATLSYTGSGSVSFGSAGNGPIGFTFQELDGSRRVDWLWLQSLVVHNLDAGKPVSYPITKSVAWRADDPNADFYSSFAHDPLVHLPVGDWTITAVADVGGSLGNTFQASVRVHVTP
jgi:hypothetical protein